MSECVKTVISSLEEGMKRGCPNPSVARFTLFLPAWEK